MCGSPCSHQTSFPRTNHSSSSAYYFRFPPGFWFWNESKARIRKRCWFENINPLIPAYCRATHKIPRVSLDRKLMLHYIMLHINSFDSWDLLCSDIREHCVTVDRQEDSIVSMNDAFYFRCEVFQVLRHTHSQPTLHRFLCVDKTFVMIITYSMTVCTE